MGREDRFLSKLTVAAPLGMEGEPSIVGWWGSKRRGKPNDGAAPDPRRDGEGVRIGSENERLIAAVM